MKKRKKIKKVAIILLIIFIIILGFLSIIFIKNLKNDSEKDFVNELNMIATEAYSEYYYKDLENTMTGEEVIEHLKKFEKIGLSFDVANLKNYSEVVNNNDYIRIINDFLKKNKDCKEDETMVVIYPKDPYTKNDFTSEIKMNCEYKK